MYATAMSFFPEHYGKNTDSFRTVSSLNLTIATAAFMQKRNMRHHGTDPILLPEPSSIRPGSEFRYDQVTALVNRLSAICQERNKPISAAVFPTPSIAKKAAGPTRLGKLEG